MTPEDFTWEDLEPGYTSVTPLLHIGTQMPFHCILTSSTDLATMCLQQSMHVSVPGSAEARVVLDNLGVPTAEIDMKLRIARYGVYEVLNP